MTTEQMLKNAKANSVKMSADELKAYNARGAVSSVPLAKGDIIAFDTNAEAIKDVRAINGNKIVMLVGAKLPNATAEYSANLEGVSVSVVAFGRSVANRNTGTVVTPVTVADASGEKYDPKKLAYNNLQDKTLGDVPSYVAGKRFKIVGLQDVGLTLPDGTPRVNMATGQQMFQTVYAFEEI